MLWFLLTKCVCVIVFQASQHLRLQVVLEALGVNPISDSLHVPEGLQLPVYVTCFWLKNAKPEPRTEMFWALLTGFVHGYLCRDEQTQKGKETSVEKKTLTKIYI